MKKIFVGLFVFGLLGACSAENSVKSTSSSSGGAGALACTGDKGVKPAESDYCSSCTISATANPAKCTNARPVDACCAFVAGPKGSVARGTGLVRYSGSDATVNLACLKAPPAGGASKTVTLKGNVRLFSSGDDSKNVKIEIFKEGANGAVGERVGEPVVTTGDDAKNPPTVDTLLKKCPQEGCKFRAFEYPNVPTETPLIIKTSDASGGSQWAELYDYNIYFASSAVDGSNVIKYDPSVVAATDLNTVASAAGGFTVKPDRGLLAGEVHDCGDVRLSGAYVDTDVEHESDVFYFGENEADPLPDKNRSQDGTSKLGLFGMLNMKTGVPVRISAVGNYNGQMVLLGTYTVQTFPGAVTALSFRGRRPFQK
ncbi:MAG: hypothetical protein JNL38_27510 [Myxococcales bacterium]|jgi:hypothetical protein|nr:hypothetical protein [Myxococcales bacterium]